MKRALLMAAPLALTLVADPASAQAPRDNPQVDLKYASVKVDYGQPPWSADRLNQMEMQIPVGVNWRLGADNPTVMTVEGGPIFFGDHLVEPGDYSLQVKRVTEKDWQFTFFGTGDPTQGMIGASLVQSSVRMDDPKPSEQLMLGFPKTGKDHILEMRFGPIRMSAPISDVQEVESEITLNGTAATAVAYRRPSSLDLSRPTLGGYVRYEVGGEDCTMRYYVHCADGNAHVMFRNADIEQYKKSIEEADKALAFIEAQGGGGQAASLVSQMERQKMKAEIVLEDYANMPDNLSFKAPLSTGSTSPMLAKMTKSGPLTLDLRIADQAAKITLTEADFAGKGAQ
jgi:hypothetical protein